jgi:hypothetical protein
MKKFPSADKTGNSTLNGSDKDTHQIKSSKQ